MPAMPDLDSLISHLPKCELHVHIEGTLEPELMFALAARNNIALPFQSIEAVRRAYQFTGLQDFLDIYYQGMSVLITEQDFFDLAWAYLLRAQADNVRHVEMFFDPQGHTSRGVAFETVVNGLHRACSTAAKELGLSASLIMCFLRHLDEDDAERTFDKAQHHLDKIIGVGLDSSEAGRPPSLFKNVFRRARDAGLHLFAHAGEEGPADYVWQALDVLGVQRVDHGNRSLEDDTLVRRLARDRTPLTVCPLSNLKLQVVTDLRQHPLRHMMERDLVVTLNSDDPAYFGGYVNDNYRALQRSLGLTREEIVAVARNGFNAAMMTPDDRRQALTRFDDALAGLDR
jgi:adenosine deaminase